MDTNFRRAIARYLAETDTAQRIVRAIDMDDTKRCEGRITYNAKSLWIDPSAPGFTAYSTEITDEELVRAYLAVKLTTDYGYPAQPERLEIERTYKSVGRPGKGGRIDVLVRNRSNNGAFLFIECKDPRKFDSDLKLIDGQLFRLSRQERPLPKYLVYFTVDNIDGDLKERLILIDASIFPDYETWDRAGQPIIDTIPIGYGIPRKRTYANIGMETTKALPLEYGTSAERFNRLRNELHDVIWGGGGTNNNEVFVYIVKLILCKIFDEQETAPEQNYEFQRFADADAPEAADTVMARMNALYRKAEAAYLALPANSAGPAFDPAKISDTKIAYVIGRLEGISVINNTHGGDLLGEFFEHIVSQDFTQTRGQFFTPVKIVRFMIALVDAAQIAESVFRSSRDHLGRPRLPYVIDPACGSGTFLIEYMKRITRVLSGDAFRGTLPARLKEMQETWFGGRRHNAWAKDFLFGVENNYDLGLAAKVNMVLHGDGSMNTWLMSGLLPFQRYWADGRHNVLGTSAKLPSSTPYRQPVNEQFDFIFSNPPFSLTMTPDERNEVTTAFGDALRISEHLFIEGWYQLLREAGEFCCILPEAILDTPSNRTARIFLIKHFQIIAIVSLPYDAFRPFTSTKTCIVYARKRPHDALSAWDRAWAAANRGRDDPTSVLFRTLQDLNYHEEAVFMAEPREIGYKRRKNLPDLNKPNHLYNEEAAVPDPIPDIDTPRSVLDFFMRGRSGSEAADLGFWVSLSDVATRPGNRLDPKYCWLWLKQRGIAWGTEETTETLSNYLEIVDLKKIGKGGLPYETPIIDLDAVRSKTGTVSVEPETADEIMSDRVSFEGAELIFSKLEPYLGKVVINPPQEAIGSPEWIGMRRKGKIPLLYISQLLMHSRMCELYRRLQSGKRHARLDPEELLELRVEVKREPELSETEDYLNRSRNHIREIQQTIGRMRREMDEAIPPTLPYAR